MKRHKGNRWQGVLLGTFLGVSSLFAQQGQTGYQPTPENLQARQEFSDSKFGIFLIPRWKSRKQKFRHP